MLKLCYTVTFSGVVGVAESLPNRYSALSLSAHASQAFSIASCTDSEDLPEWRLDDVPAIVSRLERCIVDIYAWCGAKRLRLNADKTELLWLGPAAAEWAVVRWREKATPYNSQPSRLQFTPSRLQKNRHAYNSQPSRLQFTRHVYN